VVTTLGGGNPGVATVTADNATTPSAHAGTQSATSRIAAANALASSVRHATHHRPAHQPGGAVNSTRADSGVGDRTGGNPLDTGYVATGGTYRPAAASRPGPIMIAYATSGGGSGGGTSGGGSGGGGGTGTGTGSGVGTGTVSGTKTAPDPTSGTSSGGSQFTNGAFTTAGTAPSQSPQAPPTPEKWVLSIQRTGYNVVGGGAGFVASVSGGGASGGGSGSSPKVQFQWSSTGSPVMYSGQAKPDPTKGQTQFVNTPYDITKQAGATVKFNWGETPGIEVLTVKAMIGTNAVATAEARIPVGPGGWRKPPGGVTYSPSASIQKINGKPYLQYRIDSAPGVNWAEVQPKAGGEFGFVQILVNSVTSITFSDGGVISGPKSAPPNGVAAPFPLVDLADPADPPRVPATEATDPPFYPGNEDSPAVAVYVGGTSSLNDKFMDYVMFKPTTPGSIWVPQGTFTWTVVATASPVGKKWRPNTTTAIATHPVTDYTAWPAWKDVTYKYQYLS